MAVVGPSEVIVVFTMLFSGILGFPLGIPPEPEDPVLAQVAPEECLFYMSWAGMASPDPGSGNRTEQLLAEPEIQQLATRLERVFIEGFGRGAGNAPGPQAEMMAAAPELAKALLTRPTAIFISDLQMGAAGPDVKGGVVVNLGEDLDEIEKLVDKVLAGLIGDRATTVKIAGEDFRRFQPAPNTSVFTWGTHKTYLVVGIGDGAVEAILERTRTPAPPWLVELRDRLAVDRRSTVSYFDLDKLIDRLAPLGGPEALGVIEALGLTNVSAYGSVTGLDQSGFVSRTWLGIKGQPQGMLSTLITEPLTAADLAPIPHDTPFAMAFRLDAGKLLDGWLNVVKQIDSRAVADVEAGWAQSEVILGVKLRDGLKTLGDVWTVYAAPSDGGLLTGWTATLQVRDRQQLSRIHDRLLVTFRQMLGDDRRAPRIRQIRFAEHDVYYFSVPDDDFLVTPAWCLTEDQFVIALFPQAIKGYLSRGKDFKCLAEAAPVTRLLEEGDGPLAVSYCDSRQILRFAYPLIQVGLRVAFGEAQREGVDLDTAMLPSAGSIEKFLLPSVYSVRRTASGIEWTSHQSLPGGSVGTFAPIVVAAALPAVQQSREAARRSQSRNNLKQILLAMHNYHDSFKKFPAAYSADKDGKPLLSWRVHILPFVEQQALYEQFHLDEPWHSDHNRKLIAQIPPVYKAPGSQADPGKTVYLGNRAENGMFGPPTEKGRDGRWPGGISIREVTDGTSNTIMVVEASDERAVIWTKPDDFEPDEEDPIKGLVSLRQGGFNAALCDGAVRFISEHIDRRILKLLFTRNDGQPVGQF